jgi:predicted transcriptional regulator
MGRYKVSQLEERHILSILLFLMQHGNTPKSMIYENISKNPRMPVKLELLESLGLISFERKDTVTVVGLTEKGTVLADAISHMENHL